jgi:hypothetical protein
MRDALVWQNVSILDDRAVKRTGHHSATVTRRPFGDRRAIGVADASMETKFRRVCVFSGRDKSTKNDTANN